MTAVEQEPPAAPQRRRGGGIRRALHGFSSVLIVSGVLLLLDAGLTVVWQEPLSAAYTEFQQGKLDGQLDELREQAPTPGSRSGGSGSRSWGCRR